MIAHKAVRSLILAMTMIALPANAFAAEPEKCTAGMKYAGPPSISVEIPTAVSASLEPSQRNQEALSALFAKMFAKSKATSMTVALANQDGPVWTETQGLAGSEQLHYWASVGKSYTAVIIMQLVENGRLSLNDKLSDWIDEVPHGDKITIKMLLDHSSGLFSINEDQTAEKNGQGSSDVYDAVRILKKHGPLFCPGQYWRYSNTGYLFLGHIAERIYGQPLRQIIKTHIIDRIDLKNSHILAMDDDISDIAKPSPADAQTLDKRTVDIRTPGAAGPIAATSMDMVQFWRAFLNGELVRPDTRDHMLAELYPMFDKNSYYGLGIMAIRAPGPGGQPKIWIGHGGGMPGIKAFVMIDPVSRQYGAVALTGDGPASAVAYHMLREWQKKPAP